MFDKSALRKFLRLSAISLVATLVISYLGVVQAQSPSKESLFQKNVSAPQVTAIASLEAFDLKVDSAPVLPANRKQSDSPSDGNPRAVIGADDRIAMTSTSYPWSAVGRVVGISADEEGYQCTGALIAPDVVLTNAHCVIDPESHLYSLQIAFQPNLIGGRLADEADLAYVVEGYAATDFRKGSIIDPDDWAILKLDRDLGSKYGTLQWEPLPTSALVEHPGDFVLVGYSADFPPENPGETAGAHINCSIVGEVNELLTHTCDTTGGSSGGPILALFEDGVRIVGLNSAQIQNLNNPEAINFGIKVSRIAEQLQDSPQAGG